MPIGLAFVGEINMFRFLKNHIYPIGMDIGYDSLKLVQLGNNGKGISLIAGGSKNRPAHVEPGSANWQKWAIEAIRELSNCGKFRGREVIATIPANEVFIEHIKMPKIKEEPGSDDKLQDALLPKIKQKLPFEPDDAMIKYIPAEEDNVLVIAAERKKINRHLAIYEKAQLAIKSITVWPTALANSYAEFFGKLTSRAQVFIGESRMQEGMVDHPGNVRKFCYWFAPSTEFRVSYDIAISRENWHPFFNGKGLHNPSLFPSCGIFRAQALDDPLIFLLIRPLGEHIEGFPRDMDPLDRAVIRSV